MCVLQQWEVMVVSRLGWCLASVVPSDFLEPILQALPFVHPLNIQNMRRHVHSYIALAAMGKLKTNLHLLQEKVLNDVCIYG